MKKPFSLKFILSLAILAWALVGDPAVPDTIAQTQPAPQPGADLSSASPDNAPTAATLPPDIAPDSPLAQIISLVQAGVEQSVILTYINNSTGLFNLSSDDIIYLNDLGVPTEIINAMMQRDQQLEQMGVAVAPPAAQPAYPTENPAPPPTEVTVNYFYDTLAPYGAWVNFADYGWCWRPTIVVYDTGWQPYCNNGHWVYSDQGWYWISGYSWGWAPFHYGRWFHVPRYGWCWRPGTTWAPSWVTWRYASGYCGWAPLPPDAVYRSGVGFFYHGQRVSAGFSFGLSANVFTFVPTKNFCDPHPWRYRLGTRDVDRFYNHTTVINDISFDRRRQGIVNAGIPPRDITAVTREEIHPVAIRAESEGLVRGGRREQFDGNGRALIVNRPHFVGTPVLSVHPGQETSPAIEHRQNEFHPNVHGNPNSVSLRPGYPVENSVPHSEINRNANPNLYPVPPQTPPARQFDVPHSTAPYPQEHNNAMTAPPGNYPAWPVQNQTPNHYYGSDNRTLSPRARQNATAGRSFSGPPPANHYSPPAAPPQNNYRPLPNESRYNDQRFNHSASAPHMVQPQPPHQSPPPPSPQSGRQGQNNNSYKGGH